MTPRILVFAGSGRAGSCNRRLAVAASKELATLGAEVNGIALEDYPLPIIDVEDSGQGRGPENALKLARLVAAHDGVFIASPEYNASIPPLLKNAIDWVSRGDESGRETSAWSRRVAALACASERRSGGALGLDHLRAVMVAVGSLVVTEQCIVTDAVQAFGEDGGLVRAEDRRALEATCRSLFELAFALRDRV